MTSLTEREWESEGIEGVIGQVSVKKEAEELVPAEEPQEDSKRRGKGRRSRKRSHRKVTSKAKDASSYLKLTVDVNPRDKPLESISSLGQSKAIEDIDRAIAKCEVEMETWPACTVPPVANSYRRFPLSKRRFLLSRLRHTESSLQTNISAAKSALEKIIKAV